MVRGVNDQGTTQHRGSRWLAYQKEPLQPKAIKDPLALSPLNPNRKPSGHAGSQGQRAMSLPLHRLNLFLTPIAPKNKEDDI